jgi:hypothetical protein
MAGDILIDEDSVTVEGTLRVHNIVGRDEFVFLDSPLRVDQIRAAYRDDLLLIARGLKLLRPNQFDSSLGNALAHGSGDTLVVNEGGGYKGGVQIESRVVATSLTAKDFVQTTDLRAKVIEGDALTAKGKVIAKSLTANDFVQTTDQGAKAIETITLVAEGAVSGASVTAKDFIQTRDIAAKAVTTDELTANNFIQTVALGADELATKSLLVKGDLQISGKIMSAAHGEVDLIGLVFALRQQVASLQEELVALKNS